MFSLSPYFASVSKSSMRVKTTLSLLAETHRVPKHFISSNGDNVTFSQMIQYVTLREKNSRKVEKCSKTSWKRNIVRLYSDI
jgi:hypothetical protein